jgi:NADH pyrophosphatase NudC (nudix superfamily)
MAFKKTSSATVNDVQPYLEGVAKNLADRIWGPKGPPWGTKLTELEDVVVAIREFLSEKMLEQAVKRQAAESLERSAEFRACPSCGGVTQQRDPEARLVKTRCGEAEWQEPHEYCPRCRRAFFPSVEKSGD